MESLRFSLEFLLFANSIAKSRISNSVVYFLFKQQKYLPFFT